MKRSVVAALAYAAALMTALMTALVSAADAPPAALPEAAPAPAALPLVADEPARPGVSEPAIKRTVIEDRSARIEELRVRGQLQKVTVDLKGRAPNYEVLLGDGAHAIGDDPGTSRGSAGKRVWNVLRF